MDNPLNTIRSKIVPAQHLYTIGDDVEYRDRLKVGKGYKSKDGFVFEYLVDADPLIGACCDFWKHKDTSIYGVFRLIARLEDTKPIEDVEFIRQLRTPVEYRLLGDASYWPWVRYWLRDWFTTALARVIYWLYRRTGKIYLTEMKFPF